ncbi:UNC-50 family [Trichomonas vaginalis G3]|uniref:UNC-50 family n=1 Tax=Trichomonas vaginalis (strain ATCC PRA-98 / G3) TaxID=412133 RepID=UPI0021E5EE6D|nr:UNC-50 family [Trichomonas vaginalis G3]KAI5491603.1 UNC-50 family [Trichomonas vaginalis G3]
MDSESAGWQLAISYTNPSKLYKFIQKHRHTKQKWGRDDPAFVILQSILIIAIAFIWYILPLTSYSFFTLIRGIFTSLVVDYFIIGGIFAVVTWYLLNKFGKAPQTFHSTEQDVELQFCFDVFCNAYTAIIFDINVGFILTQTLRAIFHNWLFTIFLPNTLYAIALIHFIVVAVPCILILPFLNKFELMPPILIVIVGYILSIILSIDIGSIWTKFHFGI